MSTEDKTGEIIKLLTELIDLVKSTHPKVENHTHHHYPTTPQYYYPNSPNYWTTSANSCNTAPMMPPGSTTTWSTNDANTPPE
jgi:hypothetical protein